MLNYEIFTNFLFCTFLIKKIDKSSKKSRKIIQGRILCRDTVSKCHDRIPNDQQELCRSKDQDELKPEMKTVAI